CRPPTAACAEAGGGPARAGVGAAARPECARARASFAPPASVRGVRSMRACARTPRRRVPAAEAPAPGAPRQPTPLLGQRRRDLVRRSPTVELPHHADLDRAKAKVLLRHRVLHDEARLAAKDRLDDGGVRPEPRPAMRPGGEGNRAHYGPVLSGEGCVIAWRPPFARRA